MNKKFAVALGQVPQGSAMLCPPEGSQQSLNLGLPERMPARENLLLYGKLGRAHLRAVCNVRSVRSH